MLPVACSGKRSTVFGFLRLWHLINFFFMAGNLLTSHLPSCKLPRCLCSTKRLDHLIAKGILLLHPHEVRRMNAQ